MGKPTGFLEYERKDSISTPPEERIKNFNEFHAALPMDEQKLQGARCMDCGIPFCQAGMMIAGMASGCPLHNLVPEVNDLVYRGRMEEAYQRLSVTHSFPEFTSRVCPALCEAACTCGLKDEPVSTKENEGGFLHRLTLKLDSLSETVTYKGDPIFTKYIFKAKHQSKHFIK